MNDVVKSLLAITLLAMLGGFTVAVTDSIVSAPRHEAAAAVRAPHADSALKTDTLRDSASIKKAP